MDISNAQIGGLIQHLDLHNGRQLVASSMGQEAIDRGEYLGEWRRTKVPQFLRAIAWTKPVRDLLVMLPDFNFALYSEADAEHYLAATAELGDAKGQTIWKRAQRMGATVSLGLGPSAVALERGEAFLTNAYAAKRGWTFADIGIEFLMRDPGTGYHQPRSALLLYGNGIAANDARTEVDSTAVRPAILQIVGVA